MPCVGSSFALPTEESPLPFFPEVFLGNSDSSVSFSRCDVVCSAGAIRKMASRPSLPSTHSRSAHGLSKSNPIESTVMRSRTLNWRFGPFPHSQSVVNASIEGLGCKGHTSSINKKKCQRGTSAQTCFVAFVLMAECMLCFPIGCRDSGYFHIYCVSGLLCSLETSL